MLLASYDLTINGSRRLRVPAEIARAFGTALVVGRGMISESISMYPAEYWNTLTERSLEDVDPLSVDGRRIQRFFFSGAEIKSLKESRELYVPRRLMEHAFSGVQQAALGSRSLCLLSVGQRAHFVDRRWWHELRIRADASDGIGSLSLTTPGRPLSPTIENAAEVVVRELYDRRGDRPQGRDLERFVAEELGRADVGIVELTRPSQDSGIDAVVHLRGAIHTDVIYVQCKSGTTKVTVRDVRELIGVVARDGESAGLLVAAAGFTEAAQTEAGVSRIRVDLVEAARLSAWIDERFRDALATSQPDAPISTGGKKGLPC